MSYATMNQLMFYKKNKADYGFSTNVASASESSGTALNVMDRQNDTAWQTTGSVDANNTTLTIDFGGTSQNIDEIILLNHNFLNFRIEYWDGVSSWITLNFAQNPLTAPSVTTPIDTSYTSGLVYLNNYVTGYSTYTLGAEYNSRFILGPVGYYYNKIFKLRITVLGTIVANSDKQLYQFLALELMGQLNGWPVIKKPTHSKNRQMLSMMSGKSYIVENKGGYSASLQFKNWTNNADLTLVETLYNWGEGFLIWPCGGNPSYFKTIRHGYRFKDFYLCACSNEYIPEYVAGVYQMPLQFQMDLQEVTT